MTSDQIKIDDLSRILFGNMPAIFFFEAFIRTAFIYLLLLVSMRLLGKRLLSSLSRNEMISVTTLAAAIGVPLMSPDRGLIPAVIIALIVIFTGRIIASRAAKRQNFENITQGAATVLVKDGVLDVTKMREVLITRERLIGELRSKGLTNLGLVKRLYFEPSGKFSILKYSESKPGLSLLPLWDEDFRNEGKRHNEIRICSTCGWSEPKAAQCCNCGEKHWECAVQYE